MTGAAVEDGANLALRAFRPEAVRPLHPPGLRERIHVPGRGYKADVFSTSSLEESELDDIRFDARHWDIWTVEER
jgi:hypothetical protein